MGGYYIKIIKIIFVLMLKLSKIDQNMGVSYVAAMGRFSQLVLPAAAFLAIRS